MANWPTTSTPAVAAAPASAPAPAPVTLPSASALMGLQAAPEAEAAPGPRMPDVTVPPFGEDPPEEGAKVAEAAPGAIDANPARTAAALHAHVMTMGVDPTVAAFYRGRVEKALAAPAPSREQLIAGATEAHQAVADQYGDDAPAVTELARGEVQRLARDHPQLVEILERTGLGNDVHLIKSLASNGYRRFLAGRGYKVD